MTASTGSTGHRFFTMTVASVYPLYLAKVERKGRTKDELDAVIHWLTGYDQAGLERHLAAGTTFADFFAGAHLNPNAALITGLICGVRVETIEDPLMQQIRYLDKLVDELAKGRLAREGAAQPEWCLVLVTPRGVKAMLPSPRSTLPDFCLWRSRVATR